VEHDEDFDNSGIDYNQDSITETDFKADMDMGESDSIDQLSNIAQEETKEKEKVLKEKAKEIEDSRYKDEIIVDSENVTSGEQSCNSRANGMGDNFEELENAVKLYDDYRALSKMVAPENDRMLEEEFVKQLSELANKLKKDLEKTVMSKCKKARILKARNEITDITFEKMISMTSNKEAEEIWRSIRREHNNVVNGLIKLVEKKSGGKSPRMINENLRMQIRGKEEVKKQFELEKKKLLEQIASLKKGNTESSSSVARNAKTKDLKTLTTTKEPAVQPKRKYKNINKYIVVLY